MPDRDGDPTDDELARIREWPHPDPLGWFAFIKTCWWAADWGWQEYEGSNLFGQAGAGTRRYALFTGGWSGNEEIITAMQANAILWSLTWQEHRHGGHFRFQVEAHGS